MIAQGPQNKDRDLFAQVLNRGPSFHWRRLRAKNCDFSYTRKELWEEVEQMANAANRTYHQGLGSGKMSMAKGRK